MARKIDFRRKPLILRPWISNSEYDRLTRENVIHVDIFALTDGIRVLYNIKYSEGGKRGLAVDYYALVGDPLYGPHLLEVTPGDTSEYVGLYWTQQTAPVFVRAHRALVERSRALALSLPNVARVSVYCHYIRATDADPWPRGFVNGVRLPTRSRAAPPASVGEIPDASTLPDWF